jgi:hypothetical protein
LIQSFNDHRYDASVPVVCGRMIGVGWLEGINQSPVRGRKDAADNGGVIPGTSAGTCLAGLSIGG